MYPLRYLDRLQIVMGSSHDPCYTVKPSLKSASSFSFILLTDKQTHLNITSSEEVIKFN